MLQKLLGKFGTKIFSYWCPYCPRRYRTEKKFHSHYLRCEGRLKAERAKEKAIERIAPKNRQERRSMAKRYGKIKDWKSLNG